MDISFDYKNSIRIFLFHNTDFNAENDTIFLLFTSKNVHTPQIIKLKNHKTLLDSNFNPKHPVR